MKSQLNITAGEKQIKTIKEIFSVIGTLLFFFVVALFVIKDLMWALYLTVGAALFVLTIVGVFSGSRWVKIPSIIVLLIAFLWVAISGDNRDNREWYDLPGYSRP